ncbi:unnamed protein product, partial [marine sediment metagenome]
MAGTLCLYALPGSPQLAEPGNGFALVLQFHDVVVGVLQGKSTLLKRPQSLV